MYFSYVFCRQGNTQIFIYLHEALSSGQGHFGSGARLGNAGREAGIHSGPVHPTSGDHDGREKFGIVST